MARSTRQTQNSVSDTTEGVNAKYDRAPEYGEFFGFTFSKSDHVFSFDKDGLAITRELLWVEEPQSAVAQGNQFRLPFNVDGVPELPLLPVGLTIVTGATGVGKTTFVNALARRMNLKRLIAVEPHDLGSEIGVVPTFSTADGALVAAVRLSYANKDTVYVIDSLRAPLFETAGAASSKGIIMQFFTQLTRVSNSLALSGITVVATINPMDEAPDYVTSFMTKLSASVPATIFVESYVRRATEDTFRGSVQMRPNRRKMSFNFVVGETREFNNEELLSEISFDASEMRESIGLVSAAMVKSFNQPDNEDI